MFPNGYFPPGYFPADYFPKVGSDAYVPPPLTQVPMNRATLIIGGRPASSVGLGGSPRPALTLGGRPDADTDLGGEIGG